MKVFLLSILSIFILVSCGSNSNSGSDENLFVCNSNLKMKSNTIFNYQNLESIAGYIDLELNTSTSCLVMNFNFFNCNGQIVGELVRSVNSPLPNEYPGVLNPYTIENNYTKPDNSLNLTYKVRSRDVNGTCFNTGELELFQFEYNSIFFIIPSNSLEIKF